jgi:hypothetical protein
MRGLRFSLNAAVSEKSAYGGTAVRSLNDSTQLTKEFWASGRQYGNCDASLGKFRVRRHPPAIGRKNNGTSNFPQADFRGVRGDLYEVFVYQALTPFSTHRTYFRYEGWGQHYKRKGAPGSFHTGWLSALRI